LPGFPDIFPFEAVFFGSSLFISDRYGPTTLPLPHFPETPESVSLRARPVAKGISNPLATPPPPSTHPGTPASTKL
jgi:hypothetical protein